MSVVVGKFMDDDNLFTDSEEALLWLQEFVVMIIDNVAMRVAEENGAG